MPLNTENEAPFLHIIIPAYGESPFLSETLNSVSNLNNLKKVKVTVVDDGTTGDHIKVLVDSFKPFDIEYKKNDKNLGISENFQKCMGMSQGIFTLLLGSDDKILPDAVEILEEEIFQNPQVDIIQFRTRIINSQGIVCNPFVDKVKIFFTPSKVFSEPIRDRKLLRSLLIGNWTYFPAIAWKTKLNEKLNWNLSFKHAIDLALICDLAANGASMKVTRKIGIQYRRHSASESSKLALTTIRVTEELYVHKTILKYLDSRKDIPIKILAEIAFSVRMHSLISAFSHFFSDRNGAISILKISLTKLNKIKLVD